MTMTPLRTITAAALVAAFALAASAQPRAAVPPSSSAAASGPQMGMGMGGKGGGMHGRMRADANNTSGWSMMTPKEREEHRQHMMDAKSPDECKATMDKHHQQMVERAKERGVKAPGQPRRDMCAGMK
jgi:hypothetical protein